MEFHTNTKPDRTAFDDPSLVAPLAETVRSTPRLQYLHSYSFIFESPHWAMNLLSVAVALIVPIVGPIVCAGYQFEVVEALHRGKPQPYADFDFNRFGDYIGRGVWKFLVDMLLQFVLMPVFFMLYFISAIAIFGIGAAFSQNTNNPGPAMGVAAAIIVPLALFILFAIDALLKIVVTPVVLKASLSGEGGALFDVKFLVDFLRRTWREMLLETLWMAVTTPVVTVCGLLLFIVGFFPAFALVQMADAHTTWQLYEIYLAKGGEPITLKVEKPAPVIAILIEDTLPVLESTAPAKSLS